MRRIALIAGNGQLPLVWAKNARREGIEIVAFAFRGETEGSLEKLADKIHWCELGALSKLIEMMKTEDCHQALMIGQIRPISFLFKSLFSRDGELKKILSEVKDKRGSSLLAAFAGRLEREGIELLDSRTFLQEYLPSSGKLTAVEFDEETRKNIEFGFKIAKQIATLDVGQTIVVKDTTVLAVEAIEGTNKAILRGAKLGGKGTVVIKVTSPQHDMRFDIPVIGPKTIQYLRRTKAKALAIEAGRTFIVDKEKTLALAQQCGIAVVAL